MISKNNEFTLNARDFFCIIPIYISTYKFFSKRSLIHLYIFTFSSTTVGDIVFFAISNRYYLYLIYIPSLENKISLMPIFQENNDDSL